VSAPTYAPALVDDGGPMPGIRSENSYRLPPGLSFERWAGIGVTLQQMHKSINWWIGDWLRYGEDYFGEDAYQAVKLATGRGDESLSQVTWVASRFPASTRVPELSWSHHRAVLLDDLPITESRKLLEDVKVDPVPVRELIDRAHKRREQLRGRAVTADGVCAADAEPLVWVPQLDEVRPDVRATIEAAAPHGRHRLGWIAGALWSLVWAGQEEAFIEGRWRA
jgi:hypothetical protein